MGLTDEEIADLHDFFDKRDIERGVIPVKRVNVFEEFATDNLLLPFMSYGERKKLADKFKDNKIKKPSWYIRLLWWFKPYKRLLTPKGRSADVIIKKLIN